MAKKGQEKHLLAEQIHVNCSSVCIYLNLWSLGVSRGKLQV